MNRRRLAVALVTGTAGLATVLAAPTVAAAKPVATKPVAAKPVAAKPVVRKPTVKKPGKAPKPMPFTAVGTVTAVDTTARTVTVEVKSGTKQLHRTTATIAVTATTKIRVGTVRGDLAAVTVGARITAVGRWSGTTLTGYQLQVTKSPKPTPTTETPTETPTEATSPEPSPSV